MVAGGHEDVHPSGAEDILPAAYLVTGKLAPDYEGVEMNVGGSIVSGAVIEATGVTRQRLSAMYRELGDLGDVAQACRHNQAHPLFPSSTCRPGHLIITASCGPHVALDRLLTAACCSVIPGLLNPFQQKMRTNFQLCQDLELSADANVPLEHDDLACRPLCRSLRP